MYESIVESILQRFKNFKDEIFILRDAKAHLVQIPRNDNFPITYMNFLTKLKV